MVQWLEIPGYKGYFVSDEPIPKIKTKRGCVTSHKRIIYNKHKSLDINPARALYAAKHGINPDDMPTNYIISTAQKVRHRKELTDVMNSARKDIRFNKAANIKRIDDCIKFLTLQKECYTTDDYLVISEFLFEYCKGTFLGHSSIPNEDLADAILKVHGDIQRGALYADPLKAVKSALAGIYKRKKQYKYSRREYNDNIV